MNIAGVVVRIRDSGVSSVQAALNAIPGVEVHQANADGRLVVTVETDCEKAMADMLSHMQDLEGVMSAMLAYHEVDYSLQEDEVPSEIK